jgi:hypothetical protein
VGVLLRVVRLIVEGFIVRLLPKVRPPGLAMIELIILGEPIRLIEVARFRGLLVGTTVVVPRGINPKLETIEAAWAAALKPKTVLAPAIASALFDKYLFRVIMIF